MMFNKGIDIKKYNLYIKQGYLVKSETMFKLKRGDSEPEVSKIFKKVELDELNNLSYINFINSTLPEY